MDIDLARTFLEILHSGSFIAAAERLNLTQTAVSARIRTLEDQLGQRLFVRNKSGAHLTAAGERFQGDALTLVQVWERARQRVSLPPGHANAISIGGEPSLWSPLLTNWLLWMRQQHPQTALRVEVNPPALLLDKVQNGSLDLAVVYSPPPKSDLAIELLTEEKLVMVGTAKAMRPHPDTYIHVDWGPVFATSQHAAFPDLVNPGVSISLGPLALSYLLSNGGCGYFRYSVVRPWLLEGRLHPVKDAPEFSYSVHAVYSTRSAADLIDRARTGLKHCLEDAMEAKPAAARKRRKA